jgi:hypothetical protein
MGILTSNPYENAWIIVGLIIAAAVSLGSVGALGYTAFKFLSGLGIPQTGTKLIYYIPVALLSFGVIADIISQTFKFSIGSLVGVVAMIANGLIGMGIPKGTVANVVESVVAAPAAVAEAATRAATTVTDAATSALDEYGNPVENNPFRGGGSELCSFPGLEKFDNKWAPQNILVTTAVMFYYMIGEWESGNADRTIAPGVALLVTVLGQIGTMYSSGCLVPIWSPAVAIVAGAGFGIGGYHIVKAISGSSAPFIANQTGTPTTGGFSSVEAPPTDATKPADGSKCAEASGDEFVCDLYKNGELVSTTSS